MYFDVKRFSVSDGPGIRTVLFLKGCPLRCLWCHNPESQDFRKDILFDPLKCIACGACAKVCPYDCHHLKNGVHIFDRDACRLCGECAENCFFGALENVGYDATPEEIMAEVIADKPFYGKNGGLTVSGGEPMSQFDVTKRLFEIARENIISTALDTSGWTEWKLFEEIFPLTDYFLYDLKAVDREKHKLLTGVDNTPILHNLLLLGKRGGKIHLRCPLIPGLNDSPDDLRLIAQTANRCRNILHISLETYHPLGEDKCIRLGQPLRYTEKGVSRKEHDRYADIIRQYTSIAVV